MKKILILLLGSLILAFGLYNVHALSGVSEGGAIGLTLLFYNLFGISPSITGIIVTVITYAIGYKVIGKKFLINSLIATAGFCFFYFISELIGPVAPQLKDLPILSSLLGAIFVGVGCGLCISEGGAPGGDDAIAMLITHKTKIDIRWSYIITDSIVLLLSLSYVNTSIKIFASLLTAILSGQIIGFILKVKTKKQPS